MLCKSVFATVTAFAGAVNAITLNHRQSGSSAGYANPTQKGGRLLTYIPNFPTNVGEPINVIVSNASDRFVLTSRGFLEWASSIQLIPNACIIRENLGGAQQADLGDSNGRKNQTDVLRYSYWTDNTCAETINGGNHARYWRQNGSSADSGAWFLAASVETPIAQNHDIVANGYDLGRNWIIGNATQSNGTLSTGGYVFQATSTNAALLQSVSVSDINHKIATDGDVAVLTVRVTKNGTASAPASAPSGTGSGATGGTSSSNGGGGGAGGSNAACTRFGTHDSFSATLVAGLALVGTTFGGLYALL